MSIINAILEADADGTLHLPVPAEFRHGKIAVTATLQSVSNGEPTSGGNGQNGKLTLVSQDTINRRKIALQGLRDSGGLRDVIPNPADWQNQTRQDRPLPDRD